MNEGKRIPSEAAMDGNRTRASLLLRVRDIGDQESWEEFVELYGPMILRYLRRVGVAHQDAVELVQEVLLIVVRHIGNFRYDPSKSFRAWLRKVATNRAFRFFAQRGRWPITPGGTGHMIAIQEAGCADSAQDALIEEEWRKRRLEVAVKRVRDEVTSSSWQAFELRYFQDLSPTEVADRLGIRVGTVYTRLCRVLKRLQRAVEEIDE